MTSTRAPLPTFVGPASGKKVEIPSPNTPRAAAVAARPAAHLAASSTRRRDAQIWVRSPAHASRRRSRRRSSRRVVERRVRRGGGRDARTDVAEDAVKSGTPPSASSVSVPRTPRRRATRSSRARATSRARRAPAARRATGSPTCAPHDATLALGESPPSPPPPTWSPRASTPRPNSSPPRRTPSAVCPVPRRRHRARRPRRLRRRVRGPARTPDSKPTKRRCRRHERARRVGRLLDDLREVAPVLECAEHDTRRPRTPSCAPRPRRRRPHLGGEIRDARPPPRMRSRRLELADARAKRGECAGRLGDAEAANALFDRRFERTRRRPRIRPRGRPRRLLHDQWPVAAAQPSRTPRAPSRTRTTCGPPRSAPPRITRSTPRRETSTRVRVLRWRLGAANGRVRRLMSRGTHASRASRGRAADCTRAGAHPGGDRCCACCATIRFPRVRRRAARRLEK